MSKKIKNKSSEEWFETHPASAEIILKIFHEYEDVIFPREEIICLTTVEKVESFLITKIFEILNLIEWFDAKIDEEYRADFYTQIEAIILLKLFNESLVELKKVLENKKIWIEDDDEYLEYDDDEN